ncbi:MAG: hypothetical protein ACYDAD_08250 [Acidimicrobiales bacterium]
MTNLVKFAVLVPVTTPMCTMLMRRRGAPSVANGVTPRLAFDEICTV